MSRARYIMVGGFLGSGKTTSVAQLALRLSADGHKLGLITNDQGSDLVDTAMLRAKGFPTEEIPGGCFCCRFNSLVDAANKLTTATRPDYFIAEPVGSCTDLVATVTYPLRRIYGDQFSVAPLSVLIDPIRALRIFGLVEGGRFSSKVLYIYNKQLEEADLIVVNKVDLLDDSQRELLAQALRERFPGKEILFVSARGGVGLEDWFARIINASQPGGEAMAVDYRTYAEGEALLGWLNCTVNVRSSVEFNGNELLREISGQLQTRLENEGAEIAHLKMTLSPDSGLGDIAAISLVRNDFVPELSLTLADEISSGQLIINLRAEALPATLKKSTEQALSAIQASRPELRLTMEHLEHFQPGEPRPTHRFASFAEAAR